MDKFIEMLSVDNRSALLILMIVLIGFVLLLTVLGIVFIIALRKRRPIVKVVMAPPSSQLQANNDPETIVITPDMAQPDTTATQTQEAVPEQKPKISAAPTVQNVASDAQVQEGYLVPTYIISAYENVYYSFSPYEISSQPREKYSAIKNNINSYVKVKEHTDNKREVYRIGRVSMSNKAVAKNNSPELNTPIRIAIAKRK